MTPVRESDDYKALYATVLEHPEADVPRLVLADYLQQQGELEWLPDKLEGH